jgi:hypothetical protein
MSFPATPGSDTTKRRRTVEGSCWPCKQRRVKCDLQKPVCRRCTLSQPEECSYDKILLKWKKRPASSVPSPQSPFSMDSFIHGTSLAVNERKAIDYFQGRLWPLLSTVHEPCPPPIALALRSQPVLQALCVFSEEHRASQETGSSKQTLDRMRLRCLTAIRSQLGDDCSKGTPSSALLVAVLLLYFLEGYVNCISDDASTRCHLAGALAIIDALGGFWAAWLSSDKITKMLLSELASTDLTDALLQDRPPSFSASVWQHMDADSVWWENVPASPSLGSVFSTMAEMSFYRHELKNGATLSNDRVQAFERALQPMSPKSDNTESPTSPNSPESAICHPATPASLSLVRAFQHAGLIYLYSAIHSIPTNHGLVQQHVTACIESIQEMSTTCKAQNCALFPLYVAGAHAIQESHRSCVLERLDIIHNNLRFQSVVSIRSTLSQIWHAERSQETWPGIFRDTAMCTLVI